MMFTETPLAGAFVISPEPVSDNRGFFARLFCADAFAEHGLVPHLNQISVSFNLRAATLRGLHLQRPPHAEAKLIRVTQGAIFDVIVDVRRGSPTFGQWFSIELSAASRLQLYVPYGFAHGFQSLRPETEVLYHISEAYQPGHADGIRWDDPHLGIPWPAAGERTISDRDASLPMFAAFQPIDMIHD